MALTFNGFSIEHIGQFMPAQGFAWVTVDINLTDATINAHPTVELRVPVQYKSDWTVERTQATALEQAKEALTTALALVNEHGLAGLTAMNTKAEMEFFKSPRD